MILKKMMLGRCLDAIFEKLYLTIKNSIMAHEFQVSSKILRFVLDLIRMDRQL